MDYGGSGGDMATGAAAPGEPSRERYYDDDAKLDESAPEEAQATSVQAAPTSTPRPSSGKPVIATDQPIVPEATKGKHEDAISDIERKKQFARQIIYTAELQLSVYKLDDAMQRAEELTLASGGYVQSMSQGLYVLRLSLIHISEPTRPY